MLLLLSCDQTTAEEKFIQDYLENPNRLSGISMGVVLVREAVLPNVIEFRKAANRLGLHLTPVDRKKSTESLHFQRVDGSSLHISLMRMPHPDAADLCAGIRSPKLEDAKHAPAFYLVIYDRGEQNVRRRDSLMARTLAAVVASSPAVGAKMNPGGFLHRPSAFEAVAATENPKDIPLSVCVAFTIAREGERCSILTHGMTRYGREDILVRAAVTESMDAYKLAFFTSDWLLIDSDNNLPTGDTVGRDAQEKLKVEREPNPIRPAETVISLRMD